MQAVVCLRIILVFDTETCHRKPRKFSIEQVQESNAQSLPLRVAMGWLLFSLCGFLGPSVGDKVRGPSLFDITPQPFLIYRFIGQRQHKLSNKTDEKNPLPNQQPLSPRGLGICHCFRCVADFHGEPAQKCNPQTSLIKVKIS
ncbi:hypothetical protein SAMN05421747_1359 [Parapedobacter composti]|uniref:Uncharacterized protein n=1 Tax=Parapedobacter composti TaxID=623281 RepID=A0A1I1MNF7_9SPHI|nr:hypothetical protein SAMN05421747_1359 [Parapedobacter composti]